MVIVTVLVETALILHAQNAYPKTSVQIITPRNISEFLIGDL